MPIQPVERDIGDRGSGSEAYHSAEQHEMTDASYLGPSAAGPAPSVLSRDSTYTSLAPSVRSHGARSSWGSNKLLAQGEAPVAGSTVSR